MANIFDQEDSLDDKDPLELLLGPGGKFDVTKYSSRDEAIKAMAKGKILADRTLEHKLKEFDELREDFLKERAGNQATAKFEELLTKMEASRNNSDTTITPRVDNERPVLDPNKIEEIVATKLSQMEAQKRETENLNKVDQRLRERYGENARTVLKDKMTSLGISDEDLKFLAKKSPEAVFNALGLNQTQQETFDSPLRSTVRTDSNKSTVGLRDAVYYENLRRENPKAYFSEKISIQRLKDMDSPDFLTRYREQRR